MPPPHARRQLLSLIIPKQRHNFCAALGTAGVSTLLAVAANSLDPECPGATTARCARLHPAAGRGKHQRRCCCRAGRGKERRGEAAACSDTTCRHPQRACARQVHRALLQTAPRGAAPPSREHSPSGSRRSGRLKGGVGSGIGRERPSSRAPVEGAGWGAGRADRGSVALTIARAGPAGQAPVVAALARTLAGLQGAPFLHQLPVMGTSSSQHRLVFYRCEPARRLTQQYVHVLQPCFLLAGLRAHDGSSLQRCTTWGRRLPLSGGSGGGVAAGLCGREARPSRCRCSADAQLPGWVTAGVRGRRGRCSHVGARTRGGLMPCVAHGD